MKLDTEEKKQKAFFRLAQVMHSQWEEGLRIDTRLMTNILIPDEYVEVGESIQKPARCREHVIPRKVICEKVYLMFDNGCDVVQAAAFIRKHLIVVKIADKERDRLDLKKHLNLRQKMPDGWQFEYGDIFARLQKANIQFTRTPSSLNI